MYGLKQAPRQWNKEFTSFLKEMNLTASSNDNCIFYRSKPSKLILSIYVDDGIIIADNDRDVCDLIEKLRKRFEIHSVEGNSYLGFEINRGYNGEITIHQAGYIKKILKRFDMDECKSVDAPILVSPSKDSSEEEKLDDEIPYREAVGSLMYAAVTTRVDIAYAVGKVSRKVSEPTEADWRAVKRIFRYLKGRENYGLTYSNKSNQRLIVYCDADFAGDEESRRSTTGSVFIYGGAPIHWKSQRQTLITLSSTEAEYVSMCSTVKETVWLRKLAIELGIIGTEPTLIKCDNESAIKIASNEKSFQRTRHMNVQAAYPREKIKEREIDIEHVKTDLQLADMLTKPTTIKKFVSNRNKLMTTSELVLKLLTTCLMMITIVNCMIFDRAQPVLWAKTDKYVDDGLREYSILLKYISPCKMFVNAGGKVFTENVTKYLEEFHNRDKFFEEECNKAFKIWWSQPLNTLAKYQLPINAYNKRSITDYTTGAVLGYAVSNLLSSLFERFNPNSNTNKLSTMEEQISKIQHMETEFEKNFNRTKTIDEGIVGAINAINTQLHKQEIKIQNLESNMAKYMWESLYVQTRIQSMHQNLQAIQKAYEKGQLAVEAFSNLLNLTIFKGVKDDETHLTLVDFPPEAVSKNLNIVRFTFFVRQKSETTKVYRLITFNHWQNLTENPVYVTYKGPLLVIYNHTNNCVSGLDYWSPESSPLSCQTKNAEDPRIRKWMAVTREDKDEEMTPEIRYFETMNYIYCYKEDIFILGKTYPCPPYVFKLRQDIGFNFKNGPTYTVSRRTYNFTQEQVYDSELFGVKHLPEHEYYDDNDMIDKIARLNKEIMQFRTNFTEYESSVVLQKSSITYYAFIAIFIACVGLILYLAFQLMIRPRIIYAVAQQGMAKRVYDSLEELELRRRGMSRHQNNETPPPPPEGFE